MIRLTFKYNPLFALQEYSAFESDVKTKTAIYKKLSKLVDSRSSISIASESWKEIEILWKKLEAQVIIKISCISFIEHCTEFNLKQF